MRKINKSNKLIRSFPYPYQAAVSISSDPDGMDFEYFDEFMRFLNTKDQTSFGGGLGMEITSGVFFFSKNPYNFSYFSHKDFALKKSYSSRLDDYLRSGWIDTNHAYGDFDHVGGFKRQYAEQVCSLASDLRVVLPIFTNHGDWNNFQNIGRLYDTYHGDDRYSQEYHLDLLMGLGTKFVWSQDLVDEKINPRSDFFTKNPFKYNNIDSDNKCWGFRRLRGTGKHAPNLSSLGYQLSLINFEKMYKEKRFLIIYQHLGVFVRYAKHCLAATVNLIKEHQYILAGFYKLSNECGAGKLWVCGTAKLLEYVKMIESIIITEIMYNTFEITSPYDINPEGLTIYVDTQDTLDILYKGTRLPLQYNGLDETGRYSVTVVRSKKENIW